MKSLDTLNYVEGSSYIVYENLPPEAQIQIQLLKSIIVNDEKQRFTSEQGYSIELKQFTGRKKINTEFVEITDDIDNYDISSFTLPDLNDEIWEPESKYTKEGELLFVLTKSDGLTLTITEEEGSLYIVYIQNSNRAGSKVSFKYIATLVSEKQLENIELEKQKRHKAREQYNVKTQKALQLTRHKLEEEGWKVTVRGEDEDSIDDLIITPANKDGWKQVRPEIRRSSYFSYREENKPLLTIGLETSDTRVNADDINDFVVEAAEVGAILAIANEVMKQVEEDNETF